MYTESVTSYNGFYIYHLWPTLYNTTLNNINTLNEDCTVQQHSKSRAEHPMSGMLVCGASSKPQNRRSSYFKEICFKKLPFHCNSPQHSIETRLFLCQLNRYKDIDRSNVTN